MTFWKSSEVAKEELRLEELRKLYQAGKISPGRYMEAINQLKKTGEGGASSTASVLDTVQLGLIVALVGGAIYILRIFKS